MDSIDSLRPSSLPPELAGIDVNWDDDPGSLQSLGLLDGPELDIDLDVGERKTAVPDIPMADLVAASMAEAEKKELAETAAFDEHTTASGGGPLPLAGHPPVAQPPTSVPPSSSEGLDLEFEGPTAPFRKPQQQEGNAPFETQPAPARSPSATLPDEGLRQAPPPSADATDSGRRRGRPSDASPFGSKPTGSTTRRPSNASQAETSSPPLTSRSMAGPVGPPSSRPPSRRDRLFSDAPPTAPKERGSLRQTMKDRYATGDFSGALDIAEALLLEDSGDLEAQRFSTSCRDVLTQMLQSRVGRDDQIVELALSPEQQRWLTLDHRAGFLLSLVDGALTVEELLDISGMQKLESLRILVSLLDQHVVRLVPH